MAFRAIATLSFPPLSPFFAAAISIQFKLNGHVGGIPAGPSACEFAQGLRRQPRRRGQGRTPAAERRAQSPL